MNQNYLKFDVVTVDDELALRHCKKCQPRSNPEVERDIQELISSFKIKHIRTKVCGECNILINQ